MASWYDVESAKLGSYSPDLISLPDPVTTAVGLADLWGEGGPEAVDRFISRSVLPFDEVKERRRKGRSATIYYDPRLREARAYTELVQLLLARGVVDLVLSGSETERIGIFFCGEEERAAATYLRLPTSQRTLCRARRRGPLQW